MAENIPYINKQTDKLEVETNTKNAWNAPSSRDINGYNKFHLLSTSVPANALLFGFAINDVDTSFGGRLSERLAEYSLDDLKIPFQYLETIPIWQKQANYNDIQDIIGRFESFSIYQNSNAQDVPITLMYYAEGTEADEIHRISPWTIEKIDMYVKRLQSLVYPQYDGNYGPPMTVKMNIGSLYREVPLTIRNITIEYTGPFDTNTLKSIGVKITLECKTAYPLYQSITASKVYLETTENRVFAFKKLL